MKYVLVKSIKELALTQHNSKILPMLQRLIRRVRSTFATNKNTYKFKLHKIYTAYTAELLDIAQYPQYYNTKQSLYMFYYLLPLLALHDPYCKNALIVDIMENLHNLRKTESMLNSSGYPVTVGSRK